MPLPFLKPDAIEELSDKAREVLVKVRPHLEEEDRKKNIYLRLFMLIKGVGGPKDMLELADFLVSTGIPDVNAWREAKSMTSEKAFRLARWIKYDPRLRSSFQADRNRDEDRDGGAFRARCTIPDKDFGSEQVWILISIAGVSELVDEAIGLRTLVGLSWKVDPRDIGDVCRISKNTLAQQLLRA